MAEAMNLGRSGNNVLAFLIIAVLGVMLAAAGCTGTDLLTTDNTVLRFEVVMDGDLQDYECIEF